MPALPPSIFISRDKLGAFFQKLQRVGLANVSNFSCIALKADTSLDPPPSDWAFFSSPASFELFHRHWDCGSYRLAAIGRGTAAAISDAGFEVFTPQATDPALAAKEFAGFIDPKSTVLSAIGIQSFRRLAKEIPNDRLLEFCFYRTEAKSHIPASNADFLVFTSPSNVGAYQAQHGAKPAQTAIAIGKSTLEILKKGAWTTIRVAEAPSEEAIWAEIASAWRN